MQIKFWKWFLKKKKFTIEDLYGIAPNFTEGLSVDEFLKKQRGEL